ncbi:MAG: hypothetical protein NC078_10230, partial [Ruminococcus sp.]|nr:hypothetical protein [Ruminococcus sp.]
VCAGCGERFRQSPTSRKRYCRECRSLRCKRVYNTTHTGGAGRHGADRPFTRDTVFLVCKWYFEKAEDVGGERRITELARLLNRSRESIEKALEAGGVKV